MNTSRIPTVSLTRGLVVAGLLAALATGAGAQAPAPSVPAAPAPQTSPAPQGPQLNIRQVYDLMDAAGYRDIREIEWSHGRYEVEGRNARGERVKLEVDARTGAVLRERVKR
ncbi:PepSY domain-containing protein [Caldimonas thermodepolymerans]|jgi:Predicted membrane protein|uniref:PepSY domain-containing protein n=1 Tax=Caldimonas thermodepolymerans TaxID=215580 RepID=UPI0024923567|nr:PepSY domain-containing protein [Caldimonas thermodepolymerans]